MTVIDILDEKIVDLHMDVKNKDEALHHLSKLLLKAGYIYDIEEFVSDIYIRETEGVTGIGEHIAIPHGKSDSVSNIGIAVGKLNNMIQWESLDDKPVNLIFLFAVSKQQYANNHLKLLGDLAGRLSRENTISNIKKMETFDDLISAFKDEEKSIGLDLEEFTGEIMITYEK